MKQTVNECWSIKVVRYVYTCSTRLMDPFTFSSPHRKRRRGVVNSHWCDKSRNLQVTTGCATIVQRVAELSPYSHLTCSISIHSNSKIRLLFLRLKIVARTIIFYFKNQSLQQLQCATC